MRLAMLALLGLAALGATGTAWSAPPKPVVTNRLRFRIPYRSDAEELQRLGAREIRLYVSANRGAQWQLAQSVQPGAGRFEFRAPAEGEYWFAVRTVDASGQLHPGGAVVEPGLRVVIDTQPPRLELQLEQTASGKVQLSWQAADARLDPRTLRLEYVQPGTPEWQQVGVVPRSSGRTSWSVPFAGLVAVRGSIRDHAGNAGRAQSQVDVQATPAPAEPATPNPREPIASTETPQLALGPPEPQAVEPSPGAPVIAPGGNGRLVGSDPESRPLIIRNPYDAASASPGAASTTPPRRERLVDSRNFQIGYKVDDVGPSGIGSVELFITENHGEKWWKYGEDPDRTSPYDVEVPQDGVYGFAIRVRSGAGLGAEPPATGDEPEIVVVVDTTPPTIEMMPVQQGRGAAINQLLIRWKVDDANPAEEPVSLYYAARRTGPWEPIGGWREDSGSYVWSVSPDVPSELYVRVVARDAADNLSRAESVQPVIVDLSRPTARIVDIEAKAPTPVPRY